MDSCGYAMLWYEHVVVFFLFFCNNHNLGTIDIFFYLAEVNHNVHTFSVQPTSLNYNVTVEGRTPVQGNRV